MNLKNVRIIGVGGVGGYFGGKLCRLQQSGCGINLSFVARGEHLRAIMVEASALARASDVRLPDDIIEASLLKAQDFPPATRTSFQRDFERQDKPDERDLFGGAMIRMADRLNIAVPKTRAACAVLARKKPARSGGH